MSCRYEKCLEVGMDSKLMMDDRSKRIRSLAKFCPKDVSQQGPSTSKAFVASEPSQNTTELSPWKPTQNDQTLFRIQKFVSMSTEEEAKYRMNKSSKEASNLVPANTLQVQLSSKSQKSSLTLHM